MAMDNFRLTVYWGPREETLREATRRSAALLKGIAAVAPGLGPWYRQTSSRTPQQADLSAEALASMLEDGKDEFGLWLGLWSGWKPGDGRVHGLVLNINCGNTFDLAPNRVHIQLPRPESTLADEFVHAERLIQLMRCVVTVWNPEWGIVTSSEYDDLGRESDDCPRSGWMFYRAGKVDLTELLPPATGVTVPGHGTLIVATMDRFSHVNPDHVRTARHVEDLLAKQGLLPD